MRSSIRLFVLFAATTLGGYANAAPITGVDLPAQSREFTSNSAQYPGQINDDPILVGRQQFDPKSLPSPNHLPEYLTGGSGSPNILANTSAPLPEPPSLILLGSGILALAVVWRHRRSKV